MKHERRHLDRIVLWDSRTTPLAPLSDRHKETIADLNTYVERPIPEKFRRVEAVEKDNSEDDLSKHIESLDLGTRKVENAQQFFAWFNQVQSQMEEEQEKQYRVCQETLSGFVGRCHAILEEVTRAFERLETLTKQHQFVSEQTRALHHACEQSLQDQSNLMDQAEAITTHLSYFNSYDVIREKLANCQLSITGEAFIPLLKKIDNAVEYTAQHEEFKEASVYGVRFKQCQQQALTLVKQHVVNILRNAANQAQQAIHNNKDNDSSPMHFSDGSYTLLYGKFKTQSIRVKSIMEQIEVRVETSEGYQQLMSECQQCYLEYRWQLISPFVSHTVQRYTQQHAKNPCTLFRSGCSFMVNVCTDEYQLYHEFFNKGKPNLDTLMENLCGILYEAFRPLIIQMVHMETLAEICNILKVEMLEDHIERKGDQLSSFQVIISEMMEDVQERLVYRTQTYINKDIAGYVPSVGDLAYPDKLMISLGSKSEDGSPRPPETAVVDLQAMWYPTVRRTLVCLSKLYNCIAKSTFEGIAQEALSSCIHTLKNASNEITRLKGSLNGHLFLIKHLLIIREQITPFDVDFAIKEVALDFTKLRSAAYGLLSKGSELLRISSSNALLEFFFEGVPQLTEYYVDSKKEVDFELKRVCEEFINSVTSSYIAPLIALLDKVDTAVKLAQSEGKDSKVLLQQQPFAKSDAVRKIVSETYMMLKSKLPTTLESLTLYLANKDTEYILFKPIKVKVLGTYKQLSVVVQQNYSQEDEQIIGCPTQEQVSLLMSFQ